MAVPRLTDEEIIIIREDIALKKAKIYFEEQARSKWGTVKFWLGLFTAATTAATLAWHWILKLLEQQVQK